MLTVLESINLSTEFLSKKGIDSPRINAELMLAHILKCKRLDLYLKFDQPLNDEETKLYREYLKRRSSREPLQYITGSVEFYGLEFKVNNSVLIPRQETEILLETVINQNLKDDRFNILDIGTGSGNIAVCLAKHLENSNVTSVDISDEALKVAKANAELNDVGDKITFIQANIFSNTELNGFDIIVSNPPYVSEEDYENLQPELRLYEPKISLTDNNDGLSFYKQIVSASGHLLKSGGKIYFEVGAGQFEKVMSMLRENNFSNVEYKKDYLNIERVIYGVKN